MRTREERLLAACFLVSGATGLVLEVAWSKQLSFILGNTLYAVSTVVAAFMGGLGLGSAVAGRYGDRIRRPVRAYALLQLGIGLAGAASIPLFRVTTPAFAALHRSLAPDHEIFLVVRFAVVFALMLLPTALMGMTLPLVVGALGRRRAAYDATAGVLYGLNTLGAVAGTLAAGFAVLPALGLTRTCLAAGAADVVLGLLALGIDRKVGVVVDLGAGETPPSRPAAAVAPEADAAAASPPAATASRGRSRWARRQWVVGCVFGVSGAVAMVYEIAWFRLLALTLGPSVHAFSAMLAVFLLGVGAGSAAISPWIRRARLGGIAAMASVETLLALAGLAGLHYVNDLPLLHDGLFRRSMAALGPASFGLSHLLTAALIVLPPALLLGALFPAAVRAVREAAARRSPETNVGLLYMLNTAGAILGTLVAGFLLLPRLGPRTALLIAGCASAALGAALWLLSAGRAARRALASAAVALAAATLAILAPPWDVALFNLGLYRLTFRGLPLDPAAARSERLVFHREGINAPVAVFNAQGDGVLRLSGKPDASTAAPDLPTQALVGHLPVMFAASPRRVAVIGYGSGMTAAAVLAHPEVERVDVLEIERGVIEASPFFAPINDDPFDDPRTRLIVEDGRVHLTYAAETYDVITSEPSNPWMAGVANLFTVDFYRIVRSRLAPQGVFAQHVQGYETSDDVLRTIFASLLAAFPHVAVFQPSPGDFLVLAAAVPLERPFEAFRSRFEEAAVRASLRRIDLLRPLQIAFFFHASEEAVRRFAAEAPALSTDDGVWLEHRMPRELLGGSSRHAAGGGRALLELGARDRLLALERMLPGLPLAETVEELSLFPHTREPVDVPGRIRSDPWAERRPILLEGMKAELVGRGNAVLAEAAAAWDAAGERYRSARVAVSAELVRMVGGGGRLDGATLERALAGSPDHPLAHFLTGSLLVARGDLETAAGHFAIVLQRPASAVYYDALLGTSSLEEARGDRASALAWAARAVEANPYRPEGFLAGSRLALATGDEERGREMRRRGRLFHPEDARMAAEATAP